MKLGSQRNVILQKALPLFASAGYEGFSMRTLSKQSGYSLSSIYHFFPDKDSLLKELFDTTNRQLGAARRQVPASLDASSMLYERIMFQFEHIEEIVCVLKYYLHFRGSFERLSSGYIPKKGYLHIEEVLRFGNQTGEYSIPISELEREAKVIAHAINGYLLEYYPHAPRGRERAEVAGDIHRFITRSLSKKEVPM